MKNIKTLWAAGVKAVMAAAIITPALTSCLSDGDNSYASYAGQSGLVYANSSTVSIYFQISSNWTLTNSDSWITFNKKSGTGPSIVSLPADVKLNKTGEARNAIFNISGEDGKYINASVTQWATRGDGSLGTAPLVSRISGSDGSVISISYDSYERPYSMDIKKGDDTHRAYRITYPSFLNERDTVMTVSVTGDDLPANPGISGVCDCGWQPTYQLKSTDGNNYFKWTYNGNSLAYSSYISTSYHFGDLTNEQSVAISGLKSGDSPITHSAIKTTYKNTDLALTEATYTVDLGKYDESSKTDERTLNQNQSVDVNQLIFGLDRMNPYQLLGFARFARCGYVYKTLTKGNDKYTVSTTLNADKSVNTMTVTDPQGTTVTYTFEY